MVRISKNYDERKEELLDAAQALFYSQGYQRTSVDAIIDKVGVAKGTFYYYFDSKEELLDALANRLGLEVLEQIRAVVDQENLSALDKLNQVFAISRSWKVAHRHLIKTILEVIYRDENVIIRHKMTMRSVELSAPEMVKVVKQGVQEGVFDVAYPEQSGEMILYVSSTMSDIIARLFLELEEKPGNLPIIDRKIDLYEDLMERILGAPTGSIQVLDRTFLQEMLR